MLWELKVRPQEEGKESDLRKNFLKIGWTSG